jgi:lysophospholipase L1-like esterase
VDRLFVRYVAIGNSITAGFQGAGISDGTQRASFPALIARQAGAAYEYASLGAGCPAPITSLAGALAGIGTAQCMVAGTPGRKLLNNVAVPGADSFDPMAPTPAGDPLTTLILDGKNQVDKALAQPPSLVTIWIGSNDVLDAAIGGRLGSGRPTPKDVFAENYARMVNRLTEAGVDKGILIGVADVTRIPLLVPASMLQDVTFRFVLNTIAGEQVTVDPNCTGSSVLISLAIVAAIATDAHPPVIACAPIADPAIGDAFVLDAAEQSALTTAVTEYNTYISAKADSVGFLFVDPDPVWAAARARGDIPATPDILNLTQPFGPLFSVDGVHPSNAGQILIANWLLDAIELEFGVRLPRVGG